MAYGEESDLRPLTALQVSMVLASLRAPRSGVYVVQEVCELEEELDVARLKRAWDTVAERHPALRSAIETARLGQRVLERPCFCWRELDWSGRDLEAFLREDWERGFNFDEGVPIRFTLLRRAPGSWTLIWTAHHALLDGRSFLIVWREWFAVYDGWPLADGGGSAPVAREHPAAERFWHDYFSGLEETTGYVVDRMRQAGDQPGGLAQQGFRLPPEVTEELRALALRHEVTVNTLVLGAWALLLSRYSGRTEVVFGVTRSGRRGSTPAVGLLINTLPFRVAVSPGASLAGWLKQIRSQWIALRDYEHTPLPKVCQWSGLPPGTAPFDSIVVYDHEPPGETLRKLGGPWGQRRLRRVQRTDFPLMVAGYGSPVLSLEIAFDTRQLGGATVAGLARHLETLLRSFVRQPEARLAELKMLTEGEERWLVEELNQAGAAGVPEQCVDELFQAQARRAPARPALEDAGGPISYEEVNRRANQLARALRKRGAGPEQIVAVCLDRTPAAVLGVLAAVKAGAAFLPLDPGLPPERLKGMLEDARPRLALSNEAHAAKLAGWEVLNLDRMERELRREAAGDVARLAGPQDAAYVIYTSGSTGRPKAVVTSHRSLANHTLAAARRYGITEADRRLQFASLGSDMFVAEVFNYLCGGATLVFGQGRDGQSLGEFLRVLDRERITVTGIPSTWWHEWVAALAAGTATVPAALRAVIVGMERVNPAAFRTWKRLAGDRVRLFNAYGPTETTCTATVYEAGSSPWEDGDYVPIGRPLDNVRAYVLDGDGRPVPAGVPGELYIGGAGVARGYLNLPELNASRFLPEGFGGRADSRVYRTGDLGFYLPDGNLVFLGRADRQVKIRGYRVELDEIEAVLARHSSVRRCAVVLDGDGRLMAYASGDRPAPEVLRRHLARYLPGYMIPAAVVILPELPLTASGKIDRQSLPRGAAALPGVDFQELSTETERQLASIWREVLGIDRFGAADNFFELGGDSLRATQLLSRIQERFGKELPPAVLMRGPTIVQLGAALDGAATPADAARSRAARRR